MVPEPGDVMGGRYRLEERLASGGMGSVWRARHLELESDVAVKFMSPELVGDPSGEKRFRREALLAARLRSPHIVQVFDYGTVEGQPYLVMELLQGEDLASRIASSGPLPPARVVEIIEAVARALRTAHEAGLLHRDLKPANVFLERAGDDEVVKVLDFGIAKQIGVDHKSAGTTGAGVVGSPAYMSPEQVWGEDLGPESDLWALGVLTYELLTGDSPFYHEVLAQTFDRIVKAKPPSVRTKIPNLPESLDSFFARALARSATDRFRSARELAEALREALAAAPMANGAVTALRSSALPNLETAETVAAPIQAEARPERPKRAILAGLGGVAALLAAGIWLTQSQPSTPPFASASVQAERAPTPLPVPGPAATESTAPSPESPVSASARPPPSSAARPRVPAALPAPPPSPSSSPPTPSSHPKWGVPVQ
ncbi:MAG: protein kinase [Polyangiaceae bacterium]